MEIPKAVVIHLTEEQMQMLEPHFTCVREEFKAGRPGVLIAHIGQQLGERIPNAMWAAFIPHEPAKDIQAALLKWKGQGKT